MTHLPALVTLLTVLLQFGTLVAVARARGRHGIEAPAVSGHPDFERVYRVQMNTLESTVMFLPVLWLAARYDNPTLAGIFGLVWVTARIWYALAYAQRAGARGPAFTISLLAWAAVTVLAGIGTVRVLLLVG